MSLFITGTDTGVGKTVITAALASWMCRQGKSVCVYKPVQTGSENLSEPEDPMQVTAWVDSDRLTVHHTYNFHPPVAPYVADPDRTIEVAQIVRDFERLRGAHDLVLVEGAGGVRVPVAPGVEMAGLMKALNTPVLVVARPNLGTINHTLLTVEALLARGLSVAGVVVSNYPEHTDDLAIRALPEVLREFLPVPLLALVPPVELGPGCFQSDGAWVSAVETVTDVLFRTACQAK